MINELIKKNCSIKILKIEKKLNYLQIKNEEKNILQSLLLFAFKQSLLVLNNLI
jgi:hypothetical protein